MTPAQDYSSNTRSTVLSVNKFPMTKQKTDWVVVATSGKAVDGRDIEEKWLTDAAEVYNAEEYTAMLWPYHADPGWRAFTNNYGTIEELKTEKFGDRIQLKARIVPNRFLLEANKAGQKLFTSVEISDDYIGTGKFWLSGIAVTDTPASINTTRLHFSQGNAVRMGNAETLNFTLQPDDEQAKRGFFSRFFTSSPHKQEEAPMNQEQFNQMMSAIQQTGDRLDRLENQFSQLSAQEKSEPDAEKTTNAQDNTQKTEGTEATFTQSEEQLQKMFSTIVNIAQKVENLETAFSELSREATTIPGRAPETNTFKLI